jgi:hypothetical protein
VPAHQHASAPGHGMQGGTHHQHWQQSTSRALHSHTSWQSPARSQDCCMPSERRLPHQNREPPHSQRVPPEEVQPGSMFNACPAPSNMPGRAQQTCATWPGAGLCCRRPLLLLTWLGPCCQQLGLVALPPYIALPLLGAQWQGDGSRCTTARSLTRFFLTSSHRHSLTEPARQPASLQAQPQCLGRLRALAGAPQTGQALAGPLQSAQAQ